MNNTVGGTYYTTRENVMRAYDALPKNVRAALQDSVTDWVPQPLVTAFEKKGAHRNELVRMVRRWNKVELAKRDDQRRRAVGPYKGLVPDPTYIKPRKRRGRR